MKCKSSLIGLSVSIVMSLAMQGNPGLAATFTVNSLTDGIDVFKGDGRCATATGECTLRAAVQEANAFYRNQGIPSSSTIILPSGFYQLNIPKAGVGLINTDGMGDINIYHELNIQGEDAATTIIDGGGLDRIFNIEAFTPNYLRKPYVGMFNLTLQNGFASGTGNDDGGAILIKDASVVGLNNVIFRNNRAEGSGGSIFLDGGNLYLNQNQIEGNTAAYGGGIALQEFRKPSTLRIEETTINNNSASFGGGIGNLFGAVQIYNSTISNNQATVTPNSDGGGIFNEGGTVLKNVTLSGNTASRNGGAVYTQAVRTTFPDAGVFLTHSTIANNSAGASGGGVFGNSGGIVGYNSIFANNTSATNQNCGGMLAVAGNNNLSNDESCRFSGEGNIANVDPRLSPLANNGGFTLTHALQSGSPAINAARDIYCSPQNTSFSETRTRDQRGISRPAGTNCDIGAYEFAHLFTGFLLLNLNLLDFITLPIWVPASASSLDFALDNSVAQIVDIELAEQGKWNYQISPDGQSARFNLFNLGQSNQNGFLVNVKIRRDREGDVKLSVSNTQRVPEPSSILGVFILGGYLITRKKNSH